ncbi:hypothetical protein BDU57DRAFT_520034 [Ampelomyces quisqualis]|uniref:F-box domain-containing protein n=1 Tax=Ampelomyces quisqualis TaxID=50730 RepID=A0A6A5QH44_AMPQU|nr:hypothetical protein BDU57DRAFT_520034 [Ampelomyces quisqualis]
MATARAAADRQTVSLILNHLSDMKYKDRRQGGPDQPVEFLEFRPTLVPAILVNRLWADEGTSILWKRYPHLPALRNMPHGRRQWYSNKVERLFLLSPSIHSGEDLAYLENLDWPCLKSLELEADWQRHKGSLQGMLHENLEHLELSSPQSGNSTYIGGTLLPSLLTSCKNLQRIHLSPDTIDPRDPVHNQVLSELLDASPNVKDICIMNANIFGKDLLFARLSQRHGLEALEIDLDPSLQLLPFFRRHQPPSTLFPSLRRLHVMCYPEIALALPTHLFHLEELSMDIARLPDELAQETDVSVLTDLLLGFVACPQLQFLKINIGQLANDFPSVKSLPTVDGDALVTFAAACPRLSDVTLLASEPAAIDASMISAAQFEQFCQRLPHLTQLSLKLHPGTTMALEECAMQSLGAHCLKLKFLRLKVALQLPGLLASTAAPVAHRSNTNSDDAVFFAHESPYGPKDGDYVEIKAFAIQPSTPVQPLFPHLEHLALARPQTVLSIAADTYSVSSVSQSGSVADPWIEGELVRCWAHAVLSHFPRLEILEAWSDWTGHDNDSLNYFLPLREPLASTWEFLSGIEQDLWDEGPEDTLDDLERLKDDLEDMKFDDRGSGDWERASLVNEYPEEQDYAEGGCIHTFDDEPEDMITPVDNRREWFALTESRLAAATQATDADLAHSNDLMKPAEHVIPQTLSEEK